MIIFHEGLPGSGKSYEAAITRIIPALEKGRKVYAYIEGLDHVKFAEVMGKSESEIRSLLYQVDKEQVPTIYAHVPNDCLVIIDELQDFFPAGKTQLSKEVTEFVTQHRHRGIDIVAMGQDHRDCHMLWKRRIDQLIVFVKRDAVGQPDSYTWTTHKLKAGKFVKLRSGKGVYDSKYFGLYASHASDVDNVDTYTDDRSNIFKSSVFTFYMPLLAVMLVFAGYYLYGFFTGRSQVVKVEKTITTKQLKSASAELTEEKKQPPEIAPQQQPKPEPKPVVVYTEAAYLGKYLTEYRPRLVGLIESKTTHKMAAQIEFLDPSNRVFERLTIPQIEAFGYKVERRPYGLLLSYEDKQYPVTAFPVEMSKGVTRHIDEPDSKPAQVDREFKA